MRSYLFIVLISLPAPLFGKGNQAIYEDPFDQAAGGASLTRASQEGVMFANPAVMPFGKKFLRWFGSSFSVMAGRDSVAEAKSLSSGSKKSDSNEGDDQTAENQDYFDKVFDKPIHFGAASTLSFISNNFGIGTFARFEPDIAGKKFDETGLPEIRARAELYGGGVLSGAKALTPWFSLGVTAKYLYKSEPDIALSLGDQTKIEELKSDPKALQKENALGKGVGFDTGALVFLQGRHLDYRLALKVDDIGGTTFSEDQKEFKQLMHAGLGVTVHNAIDSLHLSLDFRDISGVYSDSIPMRVYAGAKLIIRNYIGLAGGLYQGYPTYGIRLDLIFVKLGFTYYGREMGRYAGDDGRDIYIVSLGFGV